MSIPFLPSPISTPGPQRYYAKMVAERIHQHIQSILKDLKDDEDLSVTVPLANGTEIAADFFGYRNPNLIIVAGLDHHSDRVTVLVPHTSIQIVIRVVKKEPGKTKSLIGFQSPDPKDQA